MKFDDNLLDEGKVRMALAILSLAIIAIVIVYALIPYINAFFIAFILYVILKPVFCFLNNKLKLGKKLSGLIVLVLTVPLFIIPAYVVIQLIATDLQYAFKTIQDLVGNIPEVLDYIDFIEETRPELGLQDMLNEQVEVIAQGLTSFIIEIPQQMLHLGIIFTIMYFLLYYLLVSEEQIMKLIYRVVPFHKRHVSELFEEFKKIVNTTIIATGFVAVAQGGLLTISFLIFDIQGAFFWGFVTGILSILPVIGPTLVWVPAGLYQLLYVQDITAGIGILAFGMILSNVDNLIRPFVYHKIGKIHPFVTLLGIFIGVTLFGIIGLIIGPLLLMYLVLMVQMFYEEYMYQKEEFKL